MLYSNIKHSQGYRSAHVSEVASHPSFFHVTENPLSDPYLASPSLTSSDLMFLGVPLGSQFFLSALNRALQANHGSCLECVSPSPRQSAFYAHLHCKVILAVIDNQEYFPLHIVSEET